MDGFGENLNADELAPGESKISLKIDFLDANGNWVECMR